jgi:DNA-directed RNA polymerase subunit RPC12/RpoP
LPSSEAVDHILSETQRDIECPHCGMRTQIEPHRDY